jgi:Tol biopolymer transport system component
MRPRRAAALVAIAALVAACTGSAPEGPSGALPSLSAFPHPISGNRLLVLKDDGSIVTIGPDGSEPIPLVPSRGIDVETRQPVWSPDGRSVAWAELELTDEGASSRLVTSAPDGSGRTEFPVETGTFFLEWDPTSSRIAYLGNFRDAIGMGVAGRSSNGDPVATTLGVGQPFYLSWSPEGQQLLIHVGSESLGTLDLEGNPLVPIGDAPGIFQAPVWLADGRMVYAATARDRQTLVIRDGDRAKELLAFEGSIEFVASPDGKRIAYRVDDGGGLGGIDVVDVRSARSHAVTEAPTSAFHWSPDGRRLLLMTMEEGDDPTTHRWQVWDGSVATRIGPTFLPSPTFWRDYVPFYGQFSQTMTPWSPDGSSFAFAGLIGDRAGIWVQDLDAEEPSFVLDGGSIVSWSPEPA